MGRRNITDEQKAALIGEAYNAQKMSMGASDGFRGNQYTKAEVSLQNEDLPKQGKTKDVIAKQFGVGGSTVERAEHFVDVLNDAEKVSPGFKDSVLSGAIKASKKQISEIRNAPEERRRRGARLRY